MKKKLNDFLSKLRRSKIFKIFFSSFLIFGVLFSCVVFPSSAAETRSLSYLSPGIYQFQPMSSDFQPHNVVYTLEFPFTSNGDSFTFLSFKTDNHGFATLTYGSSSGSLVVWDSENYFSRDSTGFNDSAMAYCYITVESRVSVYSYGNDPTQWFPSNFELLNSTSDLAHYWGAWYNGNNDGYHDGYLEGYNFGISQNSSTSFGENLIGETLAAPFKGLNQFILYEGPNGSVSLGLVLGGVICLSLFIAFLKIFAGG